VTFLRVVTPTCFSLWPLPDGRPVISRRIDPDWLADQLQREALASGPAARPTPAASLPGGSLSAAPEARPVSLRPIGRILRLRWTGRG